MGVRFASFDVFTWRFVNIFVKKVTNNYAVFTQVILISGFRGLEVSNNEKGYYSTMSFFAAVLAAVVSTSVLLTTFCLALLAAICLLMA